MPVLLSRIFPFGKATFTQNSLWHLKSFLTINCLLTIGNLFYYRHMAFPYRLMIDPVYKQVWEKPPLPVGDKSHG